MIQWLKHHTGRSEFVVLLSAVIVVFGVWAFIEIADEVIEQETRQIDRAVLMAFRAQGDPSDAIGPVWVEEAARDFTALGSIAVLVAMMLAVSGFLLLQRLYGMFFLAVAASLGAMLMSTVLKRAFSRERPDVVPHLMEVMTASFPSGHAMLSTAVYLTLAGFLARTVQSTRVKIYILSVALALSFTIGLTRVYLGVHYPTDVLAGWSAGTAWALLCWLVARYLQARGAVEKTPQD